MLEKMPGEVACEACKSAANWDPLLKAAGLLHLVLESRTGIFTCPLISRIFSTFKIFNCFCELVKSGRQLAPPNKALFSRKTNFPNSTHEGSGMLRSQVLHIRQDAIALLEIMIYQPSTSDTFKQEMLDSPYSKHNTIRHATLITTYAFLAKMWM